MTTQFWFTVSPTELSRSALVTTLLTLSSSLIWTREGWLHRGCGAYPGSRQEVFGSYRKRYDLVQGSRVMDSILLHFIVSPHLWPPLCEICTSESFICDSAGHVPRFIWCTLLLIVRVFLNVHNLALAAQCYLNISFLVCLGKQENTSYGVEIAFSRSPKDCHNTCKIVWTLSFVLFNYIHSSPVEYVKIIVLTNA